jgi:hypothetical protein
MTGTKTGLSFEVSQSRLGPRFISLNAVQRTTLFSEPATRDWRSEGVGKAHFTRFLHCSQCRVCEISKACIDAQTALICICGE